jgi:SAM-dependent methyltransferase
VALIRAPWISRFALRGALLLYNDLTGRTLRLEGAALDAWRDPAAADARSREALRAGGFLLEAGTSAWDVVAERYFVQSRWAAFYAAPGKVVLAEPGPAGWTARALGPVEAFVWRNGHGAATVADVVEAAEARFGAGDEAAEALRRWTHGRCQLVKLLDRPLSEYTEPPPHFFSMVLHLPRVESDEAGAAVDLAEYHRADITDAAEQFDERETTLSHLLRAPTPLLGGRAFGTALADALAARGFPLSDGARVIEVGGGTGQVARRITEARPGLRYGIVDLSPALLRAQASAAPAAGLLRADARALPLADASVDVVISNEVIADLPAERVDPARPPDLVRRLGVVPEAPRVTNVGALAFLEEVRRVLRPGGAAYLSEYGEVWGEPEEARHLDHPEVGIEFGVLAKAANTLGFSAVEVTDLVDLLGLDDAPVLSVPPAQHAALDALLRALGAGPLEKRALTPGELAAVCGDAVDPRRLYHLTFTPARERIMSFRPRRVRALLLRR